METISPLVAPAALTTWAASNPHETWERFRKGRARKRHLQDAVATATNFRCAYCEQLLGIIHVEHVHPKSVPVCHDPQRTSSNWDLDPGNLIAECGTPGRCGNAKDDDDLCGVIRDPRDASTEGALVYFPSGEVKPSTSFQQLGQATIDALVLDSGPLESLRRERAAVALETYEKFLEETGSSAAARAETLNLLAEGSFPSAVEGSLAGI